MLNKFYFIFFILMIISLITSCSSNKPEKYEIVIVTGIGSINDKSFNNASLQGIKKYAEKNNISYKHYQSKEEISGSYLDTIDLAVEMGAKIIITPGYSFKNVIYVAQDKYPETMFILIDGQPQDNTDTSFRIEKNVLSIYYAEEQSGFLAGYATVKDGFTKLGFMGGAPMPPVIRYGYGFVQGAEYAAKALEIDNVEIQYTYIGNFDETLETEELASSWYQNGTEVIFACGGKIGNSVMTAAEENYSYVIGVDVDQYTESGSVITSAIKMLEESIYNSLENFYNGQFKGGNIIRLGAKDNAIGLPSDLSKFKKFTSRDYDAIYKNIMEDKIIIKNDTDVETVQQLPLDSVKVIIIDNIII